jgi:hypothetical protein
MLRTFAHKDSAPAKRPALTPMEARMASERFAVTFCEATVHAGGVGQDASGKMAPEGLSPAEFETIAAGINMVGGSAEILPLSTCGWAPPESGKWTSTVKGHEGERSVADLEASVLIWRNGADFILGQHGIENGANHLFEEQCSFPYDRMYENVRQHKMLKKNARYNIEFGDVGQQQGFPSIGAAVPDINDPDFEAKMAAYQELVSSYNLVDPRTNKPFVDPETGKQVNPARREWVPYVQKYSPPAPVKYFQTIREGDCTSTVKAFGELPLLSMIREELGKLSAKTVGLSAEGNHYYGPKSNINYHGDQERKIIICLCLGKSTELVYQCRFPEEDAAIKQRLAATLTVNHGDIYFMSEKAGGYDWGFGRNQWPEPRFVHGAAFEKSTLDAFMSKKKARASKKRKK